MSCDLEEKEKYWNELDGVIESIPRRESGAASRLQWSCRGREG